MNLTDKQTPFLHWLPDECFYSLCSRQHFFWCNQSPEKTLNSLFGNSVKSFTHDFPKNLNLLNKYAKSMWGTPEDIICEHTIAAIFFPFQSPESVHALKQALSGPRLSSFKYRLGLVTGRFGGEHPLKACVECMTADRSVYGAAYWHLSHQFPGVTTCPMHGRLLMESKENRQWSRGFQWLLPDEPALVATCQPAVSPSTLTALHAMSNSAVTLSKLGITNQFDLSTVAQMYKEAVSNLGAPQKWREASADCFAQYCSLLQPFPPFSALPSSRRCAIEFISQMTRKPRGYCHPLKHLTLISWLFGSLESFVDAYQQLKKQSKISGTGNIQALGLSQIIEVQLSKITRKTGTPRPKKIFSDLKEKILDALITGTSKKEVCSRFEISISTVNRLLRMNPIAEQQIINKLFLKKREKQRNAWDTLVEQTPNSSANIIKRLAPNVYAWLYRNDRSWLLSKTGSLPSGRGGNYVTVNWDARDENLCTLIKKVLIEFPTDSKIRKRDLYQLVPNLFSSLENRSHYPKTRRLLSEIA